MEYLFHYKDRSKFFLICALNFFFDFLVETERTRETRERTHSLTTLALSFYFSWRTSQGRGDTSSATGVSDDLASVEREESNERLEASSVIKASRRSLVSVVVKGNANVVNAVGKKERESNRTGEETTIARGAEREPGSSAVSLWSKAKACGESALKGLVIGAGAGSSNASKRASLVGFPFVFEEKVGFFAVVATPCFSFDRSGRREIVSRKSKALTFNWRRSGTP